MGGLYPRLAGLRFDLAAGGTYRLDLGYVAGARLFNGKRVLGR